MFCSHVRALAMFLLVTISLSACSSAPTSSRLLDDNTEPGGPSSSDEAKGGSEPLASVDDQIVDDTTLGLNLCGDEACDVKTDIPAGLFAGDGPSVYDPTIGYGLADTITKGVSIKGSVFQQVGASVDVAALAKIKVGASFRGTTLLTGDIRLTRESSVSQLPTYITESTVKKGDQMAVSVGFGVEGQFQVDVEGGVSIVVASAVIKGSTGATVGVTFTAGYTRAVTEAEDGKSVIDLLKADLPKLSIAVQLSAEKWFEENAGKLKEALDQQVGVARQSKAAASDAGRAQGDKTYYGLRTYVTFQWRACYRDPNKGWIPSREAHASCMSEAKEQAPDAPTPFYDACVARVNEICQS